MAEKILEKYQGQTFSSSHEALGWLHIRIAAALEQYAAYYVQQILDEHRDDAKQAKAEGRNQGLEEGAQEADEHNGCTDEACLQRGLQCGVTIANRLREMKSHIDGE